MNRLIVISLFLAVPFSGGVAQESGKTLRGDHGSVCLPDARKRCKSAIAG